MLIHPLAEGYLTSNAIILFSVPKAQQLKLITIKLKNDSDSARQVSLSIFDRGNDINLLPGVQIFNLKAGYMAELIDKEINLDEFASIKGYCDVDKKVTFLIDGELKADV